MSCMGYSGGEARRIITLPCASLMARNVLLTVLAAIRRDRTEKDESGFRFCLLHVAQHAPIQKAVYSKEPFSS